MFISDDIKMYSSDEMKKVQNGITTKPVEI